MGDVRTLDVALLVAGRGDDAPDRQAVLHGERVVPLVVGRDGHDRAGAVAGQDVVGDPDRDPLAVDRVDRVGADRDPGLLALRRQPLDLRLVLRPGDVRVDFRPSLRRGQGRHERVLRGEDHERRPEERVRPGREHPQLVAARLMVVGRDREHDLCALASADPVRLLGLDRLGPVEALEVEQLVGVLRDPEIPLGKVALLDLRAAAPAVAVGALDLLARERPVVGAPVDGRGLPIRQPGLQELQEEPLVPAVVGRVGGDDLGLPIERRAHRPQLPPHVVDVRHRPVARVDLVADRRVLGREPERIEPDRQEHVLAMHPVEPGEGVGRRDDVPVADVDVARRIRVHRQQVELPTGRVVEVGSVHPELVPLLLPAGLDRGGVVPLDPVALGCRTGVLRGHAWLSNDETPRRRRGVVVVGVSANWWS